MKVGDVVENIYLSYKQSMTVERVVQNKRRAHCVWFTANNELKRDIFTFDELKKVSLDFV